MKGYSVRWEEANKIKDKGEKERVDAHVQSLQYLYNMHVL